MATSQYGFNPWLFVKINRIFFKVQCYAFLISIFSFITFFCIKIRQETNHPKRVMAITRDIHFVLFCLILFWNRPLNQIQCLLMSKINFNWQRFHCLTSLIIAKHVWLPLICGHILRTKPQNFSDTSATQELQ